MPVCQAYCNNMQQRPTRHNRRASPTDLVTKPVSRKNPKTYKIMSVPERERYRNSTMFVGSPPFGYDGTDDDRTPNNDSSWHPPRTPPHNMVYREHLCPHLGSCQDTFVRSRSPAKFTSPKADIPDLKLVDVVPALFSSPELSPQSNEQGEYFPDLVQLSVHDDKQSHGTGKSIVMSALDGKQRRWKSCHASIAVADTYEPDDENRVDGVDSLRLLPELMSDDEHDDSGVTATCRCASTKSSSGGESPHMHDFLRCPECDHVLKWVFVEHKTAEGEHHVHRCQARCACETAGEWVHGRKTEEYAGGMVQVGRGAW